jgi:hypothetical protein
MALTYHNNNSISNVTSFSQIPSGSPVLLSTATASGSSSISFTSGIDSTYDVYQFEFINIHPQNDARGFFVNFSTDGGSNYNVVKTTTCFLAEQMVMKVILIIHLIGILLVIAIRLLP